ncbi:MAG: hypothetical protein IH953_02800 [Chloroflexi bacterium]|nr:hypothetical protein [Chloroflexota bacterium]
MSMDELADIREQARALNIDVAAALWDEGRYGRLRAEIKATLSARFLRDEELAPGPIALTIDDMDFLLADAEENGIPEKGQMVFVVEVRE